MGAGPIFELFGIEFPLFGFSHCRDVVVAISKAGGIGVLGAARYSVEQLNIELDWIEDQLGGLPYGVDVLTPQRYARVDGRDLPPTELSEAVPETHRAFLDNLLEPLGDASNHNVSASQRFPIYDQGTNAISRYEVSDQEGILETVFHHRPALLVCALGVPPAAVLRRAHEAGITVGALAGKGTHAMRHKDAGVDLVIAQSYEAGGHSGEIGAMVLLPEVVAAASPLPVLAAGGIGSGRQVAAALALGAAGVWCGSIWLTTVESEVSETLRKKLLAASSSDTVQTRSMTGKPARHLRSRWTEAWEEASAPVPLPMPAHLSLVAPYVQRIHAAVASRDAKVREAAESLLTYPAGQVVGQMFEPKTCRDVIYGMQEEFLECLLEVKSLWLAE